MMTPPPDFSAASTQKKKKRKMSESQTRSFPYVYIDTPEQEEKNRKIFTTPAEKKRITREEETEKEQQSAGATREIGKAIKGKLDKKAENITMKKKKKNRRESGDKHDVQKIKKRGEKKQRDSDTCEGKKKRKMDKIYLKQLEGKSMSQVGVMKEDKKDDCLIDMTSENHEGLETGDHRHLLIDELQEFIPDVRKRSADNINKLIRYDLQRFRNFKQQGVSLRWGRCSQEENLRIKQNVLDFLSLTGISSAKQLLFPHRFKEQEEEIKRLKIQHHFLTRIAEGVPRTCQQVYTRAVKMFDKRNHKGRFSEEELHSLVKLQNLYGNNWRIISKKMGRSVYSLQKRFSHISLNRGSWSPEETSKLMQALKAHLESRVQQSPAGSVLSRDQLCNNLPWNKISFQVGTRSWSQCRLKWMYNMNVEDLADISWEDITEFIGNTTSVCVQKVFHRLKVSKVPNWTRLSYGEIIDFLQLQIIPCLKDKLRMLSSEEVQQETQQELHQGSMYLFSNIFSENEEDFTELDNSK
ncbi:transcription termination factor 1-like isoform X2 [Takifugu flavidus]|uniref:transcription termination factor 1-like isoform X2 n=1 Tax=Takifugu flavidus TaxID=433684 RepID=UPI002544C0F9|nr:transcription termination factor 1-like isoform X2 [Takifugu flavidus]